MHRSRYLGLLSALIVVLTATGAPALGGPAGQRHRYDVGAEDCVENVPAAQSVAGVTDDGAEVRLEVLFLLDGVGIAQAQSVAEEVATPFASVDVTVVPSYRVVSFTSNGAAMQSGISRPNGDADRMLRDARSLLGGQVPADADVVYVLTNKNVFTWVDGDGDSRVDENERDYSVAGKAACVGGVRYAQQSFAIGEFESRPETNLLVATSGAGFTEKVAAHEIAHLLGAHHHYSNCAEGVAKELPGDARRDAGPCTLLFNDVSLSTLNLSTVEAAVVRGHAVKYATP